MMLFSIPKFISQRVPISNRVALRLCLNLTHSHITTHYTIGCKGAHNRLSSIDQDNGVSVPGS